MAFKNRFYPHLLPPDIEVWERFLEAHGDEFTHFDYDVRVGQGRDPGGGFEPTIRNMAINLSQRRIDAVGHKPDNLTIIEITHSAGLTAIGQLVAYPTLYRQTYQPTLPLHILLVAAEFQSDVQPAVQLAQIPYILV